MLDTEERMKEQQLYIQIFASLHLFFPPDKTLKQKRDV